MGELKPRVLVPSPARRGQAVTVRAMLGHTMESGQRVDAKGQAIPRKILNKFVCTYNGEEVLSADWFPAVAANPYVAFALTAVDSGTVEFAWTDDDGSVIRASARIEVT